VPALPLSPARRQSPFAIVTGASAGAINGSLIAALSGEFRQATNVLERLWSRLRVHDVFRSDALSLSRNAMRLGFDLLLGSFFPSVLRDLAPSVLGGGHVPSLFDATPLYELLRRSLPLDGLAGAIERGQLYAVAITATSYQPGRSFTFIQGRPGHPLWQKSRRVTLAVNLTTDHVCASAAIPIVFQPLPLRSELGTLWLGDGALRLVTPFSPAIRLGANRVFAIGIRSRRAAEALSNAELPSDKSDQVLACPPLSQICGVLLNAIFLDHLDTDLDHLLRMNELIRAHGDESGASEPIRMITPLVVSPSEDLAIVARTLAHRMPRLIRHLMDGLGVPDAQSADLMSYLLFDGEYTRALIDIGYCDASARIDEIEAFVRGGETQVEVAAAG
jgi:NTE family protein